MAYIVSNDYKTTIYSGSAQNKAYISFNNVELEDADNYLEKITISSRCIPNSGSGFYLDNLISKEVTMILHDLPSNLQLIDQVELKIGTLVNNNYEYVPIGIFNIQDIPTTDGKVTTIKLRDNSVKLDFNYNAKTLIDNNNGSATFLQILNNICLQVGIEYVGSQTFLGYNISVGIYDNSIKGRTYISYIAEQAGCLPIINRLGQLDFIPLNSLTTYRIPLSIVESYKIGDLFKITRVCYESGIIKFENPTIDDVSNTNDTLYLDSSNPYINTQEQIDNIKTIVNNFEFYSLSTGKILGNPAIDSYDIIEIYDDNNENETTISKTLATNTLTYNGGLIQTFNTTITKEEKQSNVSLNSYDLFKKIVKTDIDNINGSITLLTSQTSENYSNINNNSTNINNLNKTLSNVDTQISQLELTVNKIDGAVKVSGGSNMVDNSTMLYGTDLYNVTGDGTIISGKMVDLVGKTISESGYVLQNKKVVHNDISGFVIGKEYSITFKYTNNAHLKFILNNTNDETVLDTTDTASLKEVMYPFTAKSTTISYSVESTTDTDNVSLITDFIIKAGNVRNDWEPAKSEIIGTNLTLYYNGIEVTSPGQNIKSTISNIGFNVVNTNNNTICWKATTNGSETNDLKVNGHTKLQDKAIIQALLINSDNHICIS